MNLFNSLDHHCLERSYRLYKSDRLYKSTHSHKKINLFLNLLNLFNIDLSVTM